MSQKQEEQPTTLSTHREIMLFIGKPKGRSRMISNASMYLRLGHITYFQLIQYIHTSINQQLLNRERITNENILSVLNTQQTTSKIYQSVTKNDRMSIHSNEPSCPLSKQELANKNNYYSEALRTRTLKIKIAVYTGTREIAN